jgi:hypothetical protein
MPIWTAARRQACGRALPSVLLVGILLIGVLVAGWRTNARVPSSAQQERTTEYQVAGSVETVEVRVFAGRIDVVAADVSTVQVSEHVRWSDRAPVTRHAVDRGTLRLGYDCPAGAQTCWVAYRVEVPRTVGADLRTTAGTVRVSGVGGDLRIRTTAGSVTGTDLDGDRIVVEATAGPVDLDLASAPRQLTAHTTAGAVSVWLPSDERYDVHAAATLGPAKVKVPRDSSSPHHIRISTKAGKVEIRTS